MTRNNNYRHALKLMLWAARYYFPGNASIPCWRWPATNCDGFWNASRDPSNTNYYNGSNPDLKPGALLAVPPQAAAKVSVALKTTVARKLLAALTDYGGYLDDNTASDTIFVCYPAGLYGALEYIDGGGGRVRVYSVDSWVRGKPPSVCADVLACVRVRSNVMTALRA